MPATQKLKGELGHPHIPAYSAPFAVVGMLAITVQPRSAPPTNGLIRLNKNNLISPLVGGGVVYNNEGTFNVAENNRHEYVDVEFEERMAVASESARRSLILARIKWQPWSIWHDQYGYEYVGPDELPVRFPDGNLNLINPDAFTYVLTSSFLPLQDYHVSFSCPARWKGNALEDQPGASAILRDGTTSKDKLYLEFIQKEFCYSICAIPISKVIDMILIDKSLEEQTAELRKQIQFERELGADQAQNIRDWRRRLLLTGRLNTKQNDAEREQYKKPAKQLPENMKCRLPGITPSGWIVPRDNTKRYRGKDYYVVNDRTIVCDAMMPNGIVCVDVDKVGDRLPDSKKRLIESGLCSLVAVSASGEGLYALVRYDKNVYLGAAGFQVARKAVWEAISRLGLKLDEQCKNLSRRRFLAHDPELWVDTSDTARLV